MGSRVDSVEGIRPLLIMLGSVCRELNRSRVEFRVGTRPSPHVYVTVFMVVCSVFFLPVKKHFLPVKKNEIVPVKKKSARENT